MNDIEAKALALVNEARREYPNAADYIAARVAVCRAIEQHEAFKQTVSDEVTALLDRFLGDGLSQGVINGHLHQFIIRKPKPDPLVDVAESLGYFNTAAQGWAGDVRAALEARGLEIREKDKCQ